MRCEANYAVFRTKLVGAVQHGATTSAATWTWWCARREGLEIRGRAECIYDSELIPNSLIYPI
jgi:salicylate 5-hydroxylase small subunit